MDMNRITFREMINFYNEILESYPPLGDMGMEMANRLILECFAQAAGVDLKYDNIIDQTIEMLNDAKDPFKGLEDELF